MNQYIDEIEPLLAKRRVLLAFRVCVCSAVDNVAWCDSCLCRDFGKAACGIYCVGKCVLLLGE